MPLPPPTLIGRDRELAEIGARLDRAADGVGGLVLVSGDPGAGKTALVEEAAVGARRRGFVVAWASCWQTTAVPPLLPWTTLLADIGGDGTTPPALVVDMPDLAQARMEQARRVADWLRDHAPAPSMLVLDDLHWADAPTVGVLVDLAARLPSRQLLVVGMFRRHHDGPLTSVLAVLRRRGLVLDLPGLTVRQSADLIATASGVRASAEVVDTLHQAAAGNPLFIRELARSIPAATLTGRLDAADMVVPPTVQDLVTERIRERTPACGDLLRALAVLGDSVPLAVLAQVLDAPVGPLLAVLDEARDTGIVRVDGSHVAYTHALFRTAVYESTSSADRLRLHDRAGRVLLALRTGGAHVDPAALAHHLVRSAPIGNAGAALDAAVEAARAAELLLAHDVAATRYEQALAMLALAPSSGDRTALLLSLGEARRAAGDPAGGADAYRQAVDLARAAGDAQALGRAVLGLSGGHVGIDVVIGDPDLADLLGEAAALLDDDVIGAQVQARRSVALSYLVPRHQREAIVADARRRAESGGDPTTVAMALAAWCDVMAGPDHVGARREAARQIVRAGVRVGDGRVETIGLRLMVEAAMEAGDLAGADDDVDRFAAVAARTGRADVGWYPHLWRASLAMVRGDLAGHEHHRRRLADNRTPGGNGTLLAAVHDIITAVERDDAAGARAGLRSLPGAGSFVDDVQMQITLARIAVLTGEPATAAATLDRWADAAMAADRDSEWPAMMLQLAEVVVALGGHRIAEQLRAAIEPVADVWVVEGIGAAIRGPLRRALVGLDALTGDLEQARAHHHRARADAERAGAAFLVDVLDRAADRLLGAPVAAAGGPGPDARMWREGEGWTAEFRGTTVWLKDRKGVRDLAVLLRHPGREVAAIDLAGAPGLAPSGGTGEVIDDQARRAYQARLRAIDVELDEADRAGDAVRSVDLTGERDALVSQLAGAFGLGGRPRRHPDGAERARTSVRSRIRDAMRHIEAADPALGTHLRRSVRTGAFCVYDPDPPVTWDVRTGP